MIFIIGIIALISVGIIFEICRYIYWKFFLRYKIAQDVCIVVGKESKKHTNSFYMGRSRWKHSYRTYHVYVWYRSEKYEFAEEELYNKVRIGDYVIISVHDGYNNKGVLKHSYIDIDY